MWEDKGFVGVPEEQWLMIPLHSDWESRVTGRVSVYQLGLRDRELMDKIFDEFHEQGRLDWTISHTCFACPVFVIWKERWPKEKTNGCRHT